MLIRPIKKVRDISFCFRVIIVKIPFVINGFLINLHFLCEDNVKGACRLMQEVAALTNSIKKLFLDLDESNGID